MVWHSYLMHLILNSFVNCFASIITTVKSYFIRFHFLCQNHQIYNSINNTTPSRMTIFILIHSALQDRNILYWLCYTTCFGHRQKGIGKYINTGVVLCTTLFFTTLCSDSFCTSPDIYPLGEMQDIANMCYLLDWKKTCSILPHFSYLHKPSKKSIHFPCDLIMLSKPKYFFIQTCDNCFTGIN